MNAAALSRALIITTAFTVLGGGSACRGRVTPPAGATPGPAAAAGKPFRIAMIAKSSTNPIFLSARTGAEAAAKEATARLGVPVEIIWLTPPQEDGQTQ